MDPADWVIVAMGLMHVRGLVRMWYKSRASAQARYEQARSTGLRIVVSALPAGAILLEHRNDGSQLMIRIGEASEHAHTKGRRDG